MCHLLQLGIIACMLFSAAGVYGAVPTAYVDDDWTGPTDCGGHQWQIDAFNEIQGAVNAAADGGRVLVEDGDYHLGALPTPGFQCLNRVIISRNITVESVNGAETTIIRGQGPNGDDAVRCVYLVSGTLRGFTLTEGHTRTEGNHWMDMCGGGASGWGSGDAKYIEDCIIHANSAAGDGGGVAGIGNDSPGEVRHCDINDNQSGFGGGGTYWVDAVNCTLSGNTAAKDGGGAAFGTLLTCTITDNIARFGGGGTYWGAITNCLIARNHADMDGGGCAFSSGCNVTIVDNTATITSGGTFYGDYRNCIVYNNSAPAFSNYHYTTFLYSCTSPLPAGEGNRSDNPQLLNYRLGPASACINHGRNEAWMSEALDLDGNPRIIDDTVDMGAFERNGNHSPEAADDAYTMDAETTLVVAAPGVLSNDTDPDGDPLVAIQVSNPANGTLTFNADGAFFYTPNTGFSGIDIFSYQASDGAAASEITTVTITVERVWYEADVAPTGGDGRVTIADWVLIGRYVAGLDAVPSPEVFQRADCAPRSTGGDGRLTTADWVQAGRYAAGFDPLQPATGPTGE